MFLLDIKIMAHAESHIIVQAYFLWDICAVVHLLFIDHLFCAYSFCQCFSHCVCMDACIYVCDAMY